MVIMYLEHPCSPTMGHVTFELGDLVQVREAPTACPLAVVTFAKYERASACLSSWEFRAQVTVISVTPLVPSMASCDGSEKENMVNNRRFRLGNNDRILTLWDSFAGGFS